MEQDSVNQRLNFLVETFEKGKKASFARKIGISPQGVQELLAGRKGDPSFKVLVKILESYPQVCADWLVLGNGPMLKEKQATEENESIKSSDTLHSLRNQQMTQSADLYRWGQIKMYIGMIYSVASAELADYRRAMHIIKQQNPVSTEEVITQCENQFGNLKKNLESIIRNTEDFAQKEESRVYDTIIRLKRRESRILGMPDDGTDIPDDDPITRVRFVL